MPQNWHKTTNYYPRVVGEPEGTHPGGQFEAYVPVSYFPTYYQRLDSQP